MLVPYAVVDRVPWNLPAGISGATPRAIGSGPYLIADELEAPPRADLAALRAHHAVVEGASHASACLPCRFGGALEDEEAALDWLGARTERLGQALAALADRCEFDLHAPPPAATPDIAAPGGPGTQYLARLRARYAQCDVAALEAASREARRHIDAAIADVAIDDRAGCVAFLVARAGAATFAAEARSWLPAKRWRWSGPWPAYTFAATWLEDRGPARGPRG